MRISFSLHTRLPAYAAALVGVDIGEFDAIDALKADLGTSGQCTS
jgi:hypothetical protein